MEFDNSEYRLLDMRKFLQNEEGLMKELISDVELFMTANLDKVAGTIRWPNGVDFEPDILFKNSIALDELINKESVKAIKAKKLPTPKKITRMSDDYESELSRQNKRMLKLLNRLRD